MEEFCEVRYLVVDHLLIVEVVVRLEVDARVCHEEKTFDFNKRQYLLDVELSLELRQLTYILQATLVELNFLVRHNSASCISNRRIVKTLSHTIQDLKHFITLVVELITTRDVGQK